MTLKYPLILLISLISTSAPANQSHPSKQFNAILSSCLPGGRKEDNCLNDTLLKFTKNEGLRKKLPNMINGLFDQIIGKKEVFEVHPVLTKTLGDFIVEESIIIENNTSGLSLLRVTFTKSLGVWQIRNVNITSVNERIEDALGIKI